MELIDAGLRAIYAGRELQGRIPMVRCDQNLIDDLLREPIVTAGRGGGDL